MESSLFVVVEVRDKRSIVFVCPDDLSSWIFLRPFLRELRARGIKPYILAPEVYTYKEALQGLGAEYLHVPMSRYLSPLLDIKYVYTVRRLLRTIRPQTVISFTSKPNMFASFAVDTSLSNLCIAVRGLGAAFDPSPSIKRRILKVIASSLYKRSCDKATLVWFTSEEDMNYFLSKGLVSSSKLLLTRNAIDVEDFSMPNVDPESLSKIASEAGIERSLPVVVMVARLVWSKGISEFIEAAALVKGKIPSQFLLVAPEERGHPDSVPADFVQSAVARGEIKWIPFTKNIREVYALSSAAVLPSYYREGGFPRALLEPMALGKPVVAADTPYCRGPVEDGVNGFIIPPKDARALAEAIERILTDPQGGLKMGLESRRIIEEKFDDRIVCREVLNKLGYQT